MPKDNYEQQYCFHAVNPSIIPPKVCCDCFPHYSLPSPQNIWKALPGWIMLTRRHAEEILKLPSLVDPDRKDLVIAWNTVHAPEEVYFSTMLSLLGYLRDDPKTLHTTQRNSDENPFLKLTSDEVWRRRVCYAEWKRRSDANPIEFTSLSVSLCNHFRRKGSVFARKFGSNSVSVSHWRDVVNSSIPLALLKTEWNPHPPHIHDPPPLGQNDLHANDQKKLSNAREEMNPTVPHPAATQEEDLSHVPQQMGEEEPPAKKMKSVL